MKSICILILTCCAAAYGQIQSMNASDIGRSMARIDSNFTYLDGRLGVAFPANSTANKVPVYLNGGVQWVTVPDCAAMGFSQSSGIFSCFTSYESPLTFNGGLSRSGNTVSISFAGSGTAGTAAHSDHTHAGVYEPIDATMLRQANLAGTGVATTPARSDHNHFGIYAPINNPTFTGTLTTVGLKATSLAGSGVSCLQTDNTGLITLTGNLCGTGGGGANPSGSYWVSGSSNAPANGVSLGALSTGLLKITVSGGVATPSIATPGVDYAAAGGGGGGASMAAQLGDFGTVRSSSTVLTVGTGCNTTTPCAARQGNVTYTFTTPMTVTVSSGSGTAYLYVDKAGVLTAGHNLTLACAAPCVAASGVTNFPANSIPLATWTATSGTWDSSGGMDFRAMLSGTPVEADTGAAVTVVGGITKVSLNDTTSHVIGYAFAPSATAGATGPAIIVPFACTITGWHITTDAGTATVKVWKIAGGTAIPTSANSINTSGVSISTGTAVRSSTVTDFTSTAIAAGDILIFDLFAQSGTTQVYSGLECAQ